MNDARRPLRELLADPAVYETPAPPAGGAWRRRLLARRFGPAPRRRGTALVRGRGLTGALRPALLVGLPVLAIALLGLAAYLGAGPSGEADAPRWLRPEAWEWNVTVETPGWLAALDPAAAEPDGEAALPAALLNPYLWIGLVAASALLTLLARGRLARLIPAGW